jgi:CRP/FNR family transcriptional regulator, anaerobic regulatory protein
MSLAIASIATSRHLMPPTKVCAHACHQCAVRASSICSAMPSHELGALALIRLRQRVEAGETFVEEGEAATHFFNVTSGSVKVYKLMADGRRQITGFLFAGDFLGLAFNDNYTYSAEALTPVGVCRFPRRRLDALLEKFPSMERKLLTMASNELAAAQEQMLLLGRKTAQEKIVSFILVLARRAETSGGNGHSVRLPMTRSDIADYLGLTTETVSRVFTALRSRRCIQLDGASNVLITDREALEDLAEGDA